METAVALYVVAVSLGYLTSHCSYAAVTDPLVTNVSPTPNTIVADLSGPTNLTFTCDSFNSDSGNVTMTTTSWSFRFPAMPDMVIIFRDIDYPEIVVNGTDRGEDFPFPTFRNILTINNLTERFDNVLLGCGQSGASEQATWALRIYRPPVLQEYLTIKIVENDQNIPVSLDSDPEAFPTPADDGFQWSKGDDDVSTDSRVTYTYPSVMFNTIQRTDDGMYSLTATNTRLNSTNVVGTGIGNFELDVLYGPDITVDPAQANVYVGVGDPVTLQCGTSLDSNPSTDISWEDTQDLPIPNSGRYTFGNGSAVVDLGFAFTRAEDTGIWTCVLTVTDNDVMTASMGMLVARDNKEIGRRRVPIMLTVVMPPSELRVDSMNINPTNVSLSWRVPENLGQPGVISYMITADDQTNTPIVYRSADNNTVQIIPGLLPGVLYQFTVQAVSGGGGIERIGTASEPVYASTSVTVPAPVCDSAVSANGNITVTWSFTHTGGLDLVNVTVIYYYLESLLRVDGPETSVDTTSRSLSVPGIDTGFSYRFTIIAFNSEGESRAECDEISHSVGIPSEPKQPIVVPAGLDAVEITLETTSSGVLPNEPNFFYDVKYSQTIAPSSESEVSFMVTGGAKTTQQITGLTQGQGLTYIFSARTRNMFGQSEYVTSEHIKFNVSATPILCGLPQSPVNGSLGSHLPSSPLGTTVTFQCDDGLFPTDVKTATCRDMSGSGEWEPNPAQLVCRESTDQGNQCPSASTGVDVAISVVVTFIVSVLIGLTVGVLGTYLFMHRKYTKQQPTLPSAAHEVVSPTNHNYEEVPPVGGAYEVVSLPREEIELETNQAYGPVGH